MTETATGPAPGDQGAPPRIGDELRTLRRSTTDRVVAGVLGGLGRRLGIDPLVLRVVTAVLAVFGGVGVLLYALAWLLVPADDQDASVIEHALGRGTGRDASSIPLAIGLGLALLISTGAVVGGNFVTGALLVLTVAGLVVLLRRDDDEARVDLPEPDPLAWQPGMGYEPPASQPTAPPAEPGPQSEPSAEPSANADPEPESAAPTASSSTVAATGTAGVHPQFVDKETTTDRPADTAYPGEGWPEGPDWGTSHLPPAPIEPPAPPTPRQRSVLTPITVCTALLAVGVLAVNDVTWASIPAAMYIAVPLAIVGVGLLLGTWFGRGRGLVALGILLTLALAPTTVVERWGDGAFGPELDTRATITELSQLPSSAVEIGAGSTVYDLSALTPAQLAAASEDVALRIEQGAGELRVIVPPTADVTVDASVGAGDLTVFDQGSGGLGTERTVTDLGPDGAGGGTIELTLELGTGQLEVTR